MSDFRTPLIDLLRRKADKEALGPMRYRVDGKGNAVPDDERASSQAALAKLLKGAVGKEKTETMTERKMREMGL